MLSFNARRKSNLINVMHECLKSKNRTAKLILSSELVTYIFLTCSPNQTFFNHIKNRRSHFWSFICFFYSKS